MVQPKTSQNEMLACLQAQELVDLPRDGKMGARLACSGGIGGCYYMLLQLGEVECCSYTVT